MSGGSKKKVTVGYWYSLGCHMVFCHGPVDRIRQIFVGERALGSNTYDNTNVQLTINRPNLFGGEKREGGVKGKVDVMFGGQTQGPNDYLQSKIGGLVPAFRGVVSLVLRGVTVSAMNPYIKPWSIEATRIYDGWYPEKAQINGFTNLSSDIPDSNPAHIIHECLTNSDWGMGYPQADIDDASFRAAADTLYDEGFGLSLAWAKETTIEHFIQSICDHIDGTIYIHPTTGLFTLALTRDDYDPVTIPVFDESNVDHVEGYTRPTWGEITNQVSVVYRDGYTDTDQTITVQDIAAIQLNGSVVATTLHYPGISKSALANKVAARELRQLATPLARCTIIANRQASGISVGSVIKLNWSPYGIQGLILRVIRVGYGDDRNNQKIRLECVEDVFGVGESFYSDPPTSEWTDPITDPAPCPNQTLFETPYWLVVKDITGEFDSLINDIDEFDGIVAALGSRPSADSLGYQCLAGLSAATEDKGGGAFAATAIITDPFPQDEQQITVSYTQAVDDEDVEAGGLAMIAGEWMQVAAIDAAANTVALERGMLDTVPKAHPANQRIWFVEPDAHYITPEYVAGDDPKVKLLPETSKGRLDESQAAAMTLLLDSRFIRPYPPGRIRVNGAAYPATVGGEITITWANRNRRTQTAYLVQQSEGEINPEVGQTTTIRLYGENGTLVRTETGLTGNSYTWTLADEVTDSGLGRPNDHVRIEIESERDGHTSWQKHTIEFDRAGYGLRYGENYGGAT